MNHALKLFRNALADATSAVVQDYFLFPVARRGSKEPLETYRERVYSYELYHQLRLIWPWKAGPYSLGGEVDKEGHTIVRGPYLDGAKPDLLVHEPGHMRRNLAVVEIKPSSAGRARIEADVRKLIAFRSMKDGYAAAMLLVFGEDIQRIVGYGAGFRDSGVDLDLVELYYHRMPREAAARVDW
jgi:hypothetical protein